MRSDETGLPTFVNRQAELAALSDELARARQGESRIVLAAGEAGIGKTALVKAFIEGAGEEVGAALWGATPVPAGAQLAFAPLVEVLSRISAEYSGAIDALGAARRDIDPLLPSRDVDVAADGRPPDDPTFARIRLLDTIRALLESVAETHPPLAVVLDDLQWADEATLDALSFLARRLRTVPILLIACYRSDMLESRPVLERLLVELVRLDSVTHIALDGLAPDELARIAPPQVGHRRSAELARRSGGNPYLFEQLLKSSRDGSEALPRGLRDFLALRLEALPTVAQIVARVAAVCGRETTAALVEAIVDGPPQDIMRGLRVLVEAGILQRPAASDSGYAFRNPLMQEAVLDELLPEERARLQRAVALTLEANPRLGPSGPAGVISLALHWAAADDPVRARPALLAGAEAAEQQRAFELAHAFLELALAAGNAPPVAAPPSSIGFRPAVADDPNARAGLLRRAAEVAYLAGQPARAVELAHVALAGGEQVADAHLLLERIGSYELAAGNLEASLAAYEHAARESAKADDADRARVLASYGRTLMLLGRYGQARTALDDAITCAASAGATAEQARALRTLGSVLARTGDAPGSASKLAAADALDAARGGSLVTPRPSRIGYLIGGLLDRAADLELEGSPEAAAQALAAAEQAMQRVGGAAVWGGLVATAAARELYLLGRWTESLELLDRDQDGYPATVQAELDIMRARLATARGDLDGATKLAARARTGLSAAGPAVRVELFEVLAEIALWQNRPEDARDAIEQALEELGTTDNEIATIEVVVVGLRADRRRLETARLRRSPAEAAVISEDALLLAARAGVTPSGPRAQPDHRRMGALQVLCTAELSTMLATPDAEHWRAAADAFDALREPYGAALARWQQAEVQLEQRRDRAAAESTLRSAFESASQLGASCLVREIEALARRARIELQPPVDEQTQGTLDPVLAVRRQLGLSPREIEVLALIARGLTNRQIADELFITEKTAGHHVSNILTKLTLSSRVEAAAVAHRAGLLAAIESVPAS